jgi:dolichol-phosphate mannosyltransferase
MPDKNFLISLIIPVHNESGNLEWQHKKILQTTSRLHLNYEIIYIDDGSSDDSLIKIKTLAVMDHNVCFIRLSRNFGKEAATTAGLQHCKGDVALLLDADGQHPIELLKEFLDKWHEGYQVVIGVRSSNTKEGVVKHYGSVLFYKLLNNVSNGGTIPRSTDFRLLDKQVIHEFNKLTEHNRFTRGLVDWLGFKRTTIEFRSPARHSGKASYNFRKLVKLALYSFVSQSTRPLQLGGILGSITVTLSALTATLIVLEKYFLGDPLHLAITGTAILALFVSFLVGLVLICQWMLAIYIESIHNETQNRPLYIIEEEG